MRLCGPVSEGPGTGEDARDVEIYSEHDGKILQGNLRKGVSGPVSTFTVSLMAVWKMDWSRAHQKLGIQFGLLRCRIGTGLWPVVFMGVPLVPAVLGTP